MNFAEREAIIRAARERRDAIMRTAAPDYAQSQVDINSNFSRVGARLQRILNGPRHPKFKAWACYFLKHLDAIEGWLAGNDQQKESIHSRIDDALNYLEILDSMIYEDEMVKEEQLYGRP